MADCWIVVGVGILMVEMFFQDDPEPAAEEVGSSMELSAPQKEAGGAVLTSGDD